MFTDRGRELSRFPGGYRGARDSWSACASQAERFGTEILERDVEEVEFVPRGPFRVRIRKRVARRPAP